MIAVAWGVAALVMLVATEMAARLWIRWKSEYFVLPPGLRQRVKIDTQTFPELEPHVRFDVNSEGERGDSGPAALETQIVAYLSAATISANRVREAVSLALSSNEFQWY